MAANDFLHPGIKKKLIFEFTNYAGKDSKMVCTITDRQIKGFEKFCIPRRVIHDHLITIKTILQDCPIQEDTLSLPLSFPISGKHILEYISYCRTSKYDNEKHNKPAYAILATFLGDDLFLDDFESSCRPQLWSDEESVMYDHIFWAHIYLPYLSETFDLDIPVENKELVRKLCKIEYEKPDHSSSSWIFSMDFDDITDEWMGEDWAARAAMIRTVSRRKKTSHKKCLHRFLTLNPLIAKKVLEDDPCMIICDTNLAVRLRRRVMTMEYDQLLEIIEKELEIKEPEIVCWSKKDEQRFQEFQGCKLNHGEYNELIKKANHFDEVLHHTTVEFLQAGEWLEKHGVMPMGYSRLSMRNPYAGRLSMIEQAKEAETNKKVEKYQKQQSILQKKKNKQRKKGDANQCYQGNGKINPKRPIC